MPTARAGSEGGGAPALSLRASGRASGVLPLTGADCFLRAFDAETRRRNGASHASQLVLRLGPGFDLASFRDAFQSVVLANPILRAPIGRRFGIGAPVYRTARAARAALPGIFVHESHAPRPRDREGVLALPRCIPARLNDVFAARRGELLRADVVRHDDGTDVALTWLHMLFDGSGSERFVAFLEACGRGDRAPDCVPPADRPGAAPDVALPPDARIRGRMAREWQRHMRDHGLRVRSLAGPLRDVRQNLTSRVHVFGAGDTVVIRERATRAAGFLTPMLFYLAASIRAHHAVMCRRGTAPGGYVIPLPVNLRPKSGDGALFRTRVSMLWFAVESRLAEDLPALLSELKEQRRRAIRDGQIDAGVAALDFARFAPARLYAHVARRPLGGELCSFFFAYTDAFCQGVERFFGAELLHGFHAPSVPASPGSALVFSLCRDRLHTTHVWQRGVLDEAELAVLHQQLGRDLLGAP